MNTFLKMGNENDTGNSDVKSPHVCDSSCLGPLTFHCQTVGEKVTLSHGGRLAKRTPTTFKHGLLFSSRQVRIQEKIRLKVMRDLHNWNGVLRVGFTSVPPAARPLPLPPMAIPDLTSKPGYWAVPLDDSYCQEHSELEIWVSSLGTIYVSYNNSKYVKLHKGVDVSQPLWAMIDLYGNTSSICLLGSYKKGLFYTKRSCPPPDDSDHPVIPDTDKCMDCLDMNIPAYQCTQEDCVVCLGKEAKVTLPCGHRCLCRDCTSRIIRDFGSCPLCRHEF